MSTAPPPVAEIEVPVRVSRNLYDRLAALARRTGLTPAQLGALALAEYAARLEQGPPEKLPKPETLASRQTPLDRFFDQMSLQEAFEKTQSVPFGPGQGPGSGPGPGSRDGET